MKMKLQEALPYKTWSPLRPKPKRAKYHDFNLNTSVRNEFPSEKDVITKIASENAVVVFARPGCCMCHVAKRLLQSLGTNPLVQEIEENDEIAICDQFPAVYIGGEFYGGLDRLITEHISGDLVPVLKKGGALWL